jgi:hypothetical protein
LVIRTPRDVAFSSLSALPGHDSTGATNQERPARFLKETRRHSGYEMAILPRSVLSDRGDAVAACANAPDICGHGAGGGAAVDRPRDRPGSVEAVKGLPTISLVICERININVDSLDGGIALDPAKYRVNARIIAFTAARRRGVTLAPEDTTTL